MSFEIKGFTPLTTIDWRGKLAAMLFIGGCNFRCPYCQNPDLVINLAQTPALDWEEIWNNLKERGKWLDGVIVGGGEPTLYPKELKRMLERIKSLGYPVKIDTNGSQPAVIEQLIAGNEPLVDFVAMDIKTSLDKYSRATRIADKKVEQRIDQTIDYILDSCVEYEFRTTVVPNYAGKEEIPEVANYLGKKGAKNYVLQPFDPRVTLDVEAKFVEPYSKDTLENLLQECKKILPTNLRFPESF